MDWSTLQFGYVPLTADLKGPGDRRRFVSWAEARQLHYEIADPRQRYDVVYLTYNCDIATWINYKRQHGSRVKLIFELVDSYLFENLSWKTRFRGMAKFLTGSSSKLWWNYSKGIEAICRIADAVVCATTEQREALLAFNDNVHLSLDVFEDDITATKTDFSTRDKLQLVWEGQPYTIDNLLVIKDVLNALAGEVVLHLVTDVHYYRFSKKYIRRHTLDILRPLRCPIELHAWHRETFSQNVCAADLAIIPINLANRLAAGKPENKLILFWLSQMPALTAPTKAYSRVMEKSGIHMECIDAESWIEQIRAYQRSTETQRAALAAKCHRYASTHYSREQRYRDWDHLLMSVLK